MKSVGFKFNLDEKVTVEKNDFSGVITMCAIQGEPERPEIVYYISGASFGNWYPERLIKFFEE